MTPTEHHFLFPHIPFMYIPSSYMVFQCSNRDCTLLHAKVLAINYVTLYPFSLLITDNLVIVNPLYYYMYCWKTCVQLRMLFNKIIYSSTTAVGITPLNNVLYTTVAMVEHYMCRCNNTVCLYIIYNNEVEDSLIQWNMCRCGQQESF